MAFGGLATAAGAGEGLETLFARMRAEEALRNQGKSIDIDKFNAESADRGRTGTLDLQNRDLAEKASEFAAGAPQRTAEVANLGANTLHTGAETDSLGMRNSILKGLFSTDGGAGSGAMGGPTSGANAGGGAGVASLDNPAGRLRLSVAGVTPSSIFEKPTGDEEYLDRYAQQHGMVDRNDPKFSHDMEIAALREKPQTVIAQGGLDLRREDSANRKKESDLRIKAAEAKLNDIPVLQREIALADFRNRIQNDITTSRTWAQWWNGEAVQDPSAQIDNIAADIMTKYGGKSTVAASGAPAPGTQQGGDDLDAILAQRRQQKGPGQ